MVLFAQPKNMNIEKVVQQHVQNGFNGVVLVAEKGKPIYHRAIGFGDFAKRTSLQPDDIFEMASLSKAFTAMIIMKLKEKGKLQYDDLLENYLTTPYKGITIRHLLTHTSGLPDYQEIMDRYWDKSKAAGNNDILDYLNRYAPPALFEPGTKYDYSNTGYVLLASIAEKVSGKDFIKLSRKWIFKPLKMHSTNIRTLEEKAATDNFAIGHIYVPERQVYVRADSFPSSDYTIWLGNRKGPGRVSSTAVDLLKWDQAWYTEKLVKQATINEAFQPMTLENNTVSQYGFGWVLRSHPKLGKNTFHTGDNPGYENRFARYIDANKTVILLSNNAYEKIDDLLSELEKELE